MKFYKGSNKPPEYSDLTKSQKYGPPTAFCRHGNDIRLDCIECERVKKEERQKLADSEDAKKSILGIANSLREF